MKNFGFGCMRLPMKDKQVDYDEFKKMIDLFIQSGFVYFDTAHGYLDGLSETSIRDCLVNRYPRSAYLLADKLSEPYFEKEEDIRPFFMSQLKLCGVEYFDYYLMHSQNRGNYGKYQECKAYETAFQLKKEGLIKHVGISFHDIPEFLDQILSTYPEIEFVQIQFNYLDYENENVQGRKVYEVANKHNKKIIIMEPVKGGCLANIPASAEKIFDSIGSACYASYAVRYAASFENVVMVLSGMSNLDQVKDNVSFMKEFVPLSKKEYIAIDQVVEEIKKYNTIPCTGCRYCVAGCPKHILIPDIITILNNKKVYNDWHSKTKYAKLTEESGKASSCIKCGKCEAICPQKLDIRNILVEASTILE